ncbi:hypothetical protein [uncultured Shewanella sp.]|uniref:hypothetical protein n=1 Tax=uncultured Shewanella sp. TaxID=173975 RepID=UPI00262CA3D2|nr:hypothetical protein [uncultured Shewanella sp.]
MYSSKVDYKATTRDVVQYLEEDRISEYNVVRNLLESIDFAYLFHGADYYQAIDDIQYLTQVQTDANDIEIATRLNRLNHLIGTHADLSLEIMLSPAPLSSEPLDQLNINLYYKAYEKKYSSHYKVHTLTIQNSVTSQIFNYLKPQYHNDFIGKALRQFEHNIYQVDNYSATTFQASLATKSLLSECCDKTSWSEIHSIDPTFFNAFSEEAALEIKHIIRQLLDPKVAPGTPELQAVLLKKVNEAYDESLGIKLKLDMDFATFELEKLGEKAENTILTLPESVASNITWYDRETGHSGQVFRPSLFSRIALLDFLTPRDIPINRAGLFKDTATDVVHHLSNLISRGDSSEMGDEQWAEHFVYGARISRWAEDFKKSDTEMMHDMQQLFYPLASVPKGEARDALLAEKLTQVALVFNAELTSIDIEVIDEATNQYQFVLNCQFDGSGNSITLPYLGSWKVFKYLASQPNGQLINHAVLAFKDRFYAKVYDADAELSIPIAKLLDMMTDNMLREKEADVLTSLSHALVFEGLKNDENVESIFYEVKHAFQTLYLNKTSDKHLAMCFQVIDKYCTNESRKIQFFVDIRADLGNNQDEVGVDLYWIKPSTENSERGQWHSLNRSLPSNQLSLLTKGKENGLLHKAVLRTLDRMEKMIHVVIEKAEKAKSIREYGQEVEQIELLRQAPIKSKLMHYVKGVGEHLSYVKEAAEYLFVQDDHITPDVLDGISPINNTFVVEWAQNFTIDGAEVS